MSSPSAALCMAATALFGFGMLGMMAAPAQARPDCYFIAHNPATGLMEPTAMPGR